MAEPAIQTCGGCGAQISQRGPRWECPSCGHDNRVGRSQLGSPARVEPYRKLARKSLHLKVVQPAHERPLTRADCANVPRPCPYVGCRYHLALDVTFAGSLKFNFPDFEPTELPTSCSLDVVETHGALTADAVARLLNVTHERVRMIEEAALEKLASELDPEDFL